MNLSLRRKNPFHSNLLCNVDLNYPTLSAAVEGGPRNVTHPFVSVAIFIIIWVAHYIAFVFTALKITTYYFISVNRFFTLHHSPPPSSPLSLTHYEVWLPPSVSSSSPPYPTQPVFILWVPLRLTIRREGRDSTASGPSWALSFCLCLFIIRLRPWQRELSKALLEPLCVHAPLPASFSVLLRIMDVPAWSPSAHAPDVHAKECWCMVMASEETEIEWHT